jgi:hypothetical protein
MPRVHGLLPIARRLTFLYLVALVMTVGSERMFWFWAPGIGTHLEVAAWYTAAAAAGVALIRRFRVHSWWSLMLVAPVVAYVVEGAITPMLYTGGPFIPFFPAWFTAWHGVGAFAVLVLVIRKLLLAESRVALTGLSIGLGLFWGAWSTTLWLPEALTNPDLLEEQGTLHVLDPSEFAFFVARFTAVLVIGHALLGRVWPTTAAPVGRLTRGERLVTAIVLLGVTIWTVTAPWAVPMFVVYAGVQILALRRHRARSDAETRDLIEQLAGRVRLRALAPLTLIAPCAAITYTTLWKLEPTEATLEFLMYSVIGVQTLVGAVVIVEAHRRARRASRAAAAPAQRPDGTSRENGRSVTVPPTAAPDLTMWMRSPIAHVTESRPKPMLRSSL